jgi:serine/threonine-protein kinase
MKLGRKIGRDTLTGILIVAVVFLGGMLILLIVTDAMIMPTFTRQGVEVEVPNVVDLSQQAAEARIEESDLKVEIGSEEYDQSRPKGTVILQHPEGGSKVKAGRRVVLTLSKGSASAKVPDLEGFTLREARMMLEREGLMQGEIIWQADLDQPDGVVISSIPPAGTIMRLNAEVQLIVNRLDTEMLIAMPRFIGMDLSEARKLAGDNYLMVGSVNYSVDRELLPETVMGQSIQPGKMVEKWTTVELTVSATE